jgi:hypothetical protein
MRRHNVADEIRRSRLFYHWFNRLIRRNHKLQTVARTSLDVQ